MRPWWYTAYISTTLTGVYHMRPYVDLEREFASGAAYRREEDFHIAYGVARESNTEAINSLIHAACEDLSITGEQLYAELEEGGDHPDIYSETLTPKALRLTAETLALMRGSMTLGRVTKPAPLVFCAKLCDPLI
jgi:hypothetical protein